MWSLGRIVPFLLASPTTKWQPQTPNELSAGFQQLYKSLERPAVQHKTISKDFRFNFVTPPTFDGTTTWTLTEDLLHEYGMETQEDGGKPVALYLPGLDGFGISAASNQFDDMARVFDFWRMTILPMDRSTFMEVVNNVTDFVLELSQGNTRKVTLLGESCGGLLASAVAIKLARRGKDDVLQGLVLCNPATSFDQTAWEALVPVLTSLPSKSGPDHHFSPTPDEADEEELTAYAVLGSLILSSLVPDNDQKSKIAELIMGLPGLDIPPTDFGQMEGMWNATAQSFRGMEERLPPATLQHRVMNWLGVGTSIVNGRLSEIQAPTLVVVGEEDTLMPSKNEGERLKKTLPNANTLQVKKRGHFVLDDTVNLTEAILYSTIDPLNWKETKRKYDPIRDWKVPAAEDIELTVENSVKPLERVFSPVYFSTDANGKRWKGLTKIPDKKGPLLFVANHQTLAADMRFIFSKIYEETGAFPRGLAHPVIFATQNTTELLGRTPGLTGRLGIGPGGNADFQQFGVVQVSPRNYYRLMQTNQTAMLFPGGAKEALSGDRSYPLWWPQGDKADFVRTAARFNATIVPVSAIGMADSFDTLLKYEDLERLPVVGPRVKNFTSSMSGARYDSRNESDFKADIMSPTVPARNYVLFGKAVDTTDLDPKDVESCYKIYKSLYSEVREGLDDLMEARKRDPFRDTPRRVIYEQVFKKQAPTFSVDELN